MPALWAAAAAPAHFAPATTGRATLSLEVISLLEGANTMAQRRGTKESTGDGSGRTPGRERELLAEHARGGARGPVAPRRPQVKNQPEPPFPEQQQHDKSTGIESEVRPRPEYQAPL